MNSDEADRLQKEWGDKPCDHPDIIEQLETEFTADVKWRFVQCGRLVDFDEWHSSHKHP